MLVLVSDIHLMDRPGPASVHGGRLMRRLTELAEQNDRQSLDHFTIAFIGDVFDLLHSQLWLERDVRPWERVTDTHKETVREIYQMIRSANPGFFDGLVNLKNAFPYTHVHYLPGNHDRALNTSMGELVRKQVCRDLALEEAGSIFQDTLVFDEYSTMARHGHEWDARNLYALGRAAIGDFIVIDILERLPRSIAASLSWDIADPRLAYFREIAYVVPQNLRNILGWIFAGLSQLEESEPGVRDTAERALLQIFDVAEQFVKRERELFLLPQYLSWLINLANSKFLRNRRITMLELARFLRFSIGGDPFVYRQLLTAQSNFAAVFFGTFKILAAGHTHEALLETKIDDQTRRFVNTGAWGRSHEVRVGTRTFDATSFDTYDYDTIAIVFSEREQRMFGMDACRLEEGKVLVPRA